jgi:AcrR family transcriptional regulator
MSEDKKREIYAMAARLFAEKGFENTSTRDISRAAGMSDAGLYYYFESKEVLLYEILNEILGNGLISVREIEASEKSPEEKLADFTKFYARYYSKEIDLVKLLVEEQKKVTGVYRKRLDAVQREYLDIMVRILDAMKREGKMEDMDSTVCAFAFFAMVHWVYRWYNPKGKVSPEKISETFYRIMNYGIRSCSEARA